MYTSSVLLTHMYICTILIIITHIFSGETDVRNFDAEFTRERAVDSVVTSHLTGTMAAKSDFENFTYHGSGHM